MMTQPPTTCLTPKPHDIGKRCKKQRRVFIAEVAEELAVRSVSMPSFWSALANSAWNMRRSNGSPSSSGSS
jgi:hypothetical protein